MFVAHVLLYLLLPQPLLPLSAEEAGVAAQAGGKQHCAGGRAIQQGGDAVGGEEVGA